MAYLGLQGQGLSGKGRNWSVVIEAEVVAAQQWRLLVLEDDANLRQVLKDVLSDEGYQVTAASTGAEAVELASHQTFDLIITDIRMDGVDGLQALERARSFLPEVSSLVVSGYTTEAETLRALQLNVGGYLKKPFALADFLQKTRELLSQRKLQREQTDRFQALRSSLWWSLESRAGIDLEAAHRAIYLGQKMGFSPEQTQLVRLATGLYSSGLGLQWPAHTVRDQARTGSHSADLSRGQSLQPRPTCRFGSPDSAAGSLPRDRASCV